MSRRLAASLLALAALFTGVTACGSDIDDDRERVVYVERDEDDD